jgi:hypothetical protein
MTRIDTDNGNILCNEFVFEYLNAREVGVIVKNNFIAYYDDDEKITEIRGKNCSINRNDELALTLNTKFKTVHKINKIYFRKDIIHNYDFFISTGDLNKTVHYITPFLGNNAGYFSIDKRLINSYISDNFTFIYMKYRFSNAKSFNDLDRRLKQVKDFREVINDSPYTITYKFSINYNYRNDVRLILEGKYSEISNHAKTRIISFHEKDNYIQGVLHKDPALKAFLEEKLNCSIPDKIDLTDKPNKQLEIWPI